MITNSIISQRLPVWQALSEFFLDTELTESAYRSIAERLAESPYTLKEIQRILENEVYPVCRHNISVAGVWAGFDEAWIKEKMAPRIGKKRLLNIPPLCAWIYREDWKKVQTLIREKRT